LKLFYTAARSQVVHPSLGRILAYTGAGVQDTGQFHDRHFPVQPNLEQLRHQAKDLLRDPRLNDPEAVGALRKHHPKALDPALIKLADAQLVLARIYGPPHLGQACHGLPHDGRGHTGLSVIARN